MRLKLISLVASLLVIIRPLAAEAPAQPSKYEIYSWKNGNDWEYSLLPASKNTTKAAVEIKHEGGPLRGSSKVKEKLLTMKEGDSVSWQERANSGMVYPPDLVIEDIKGYAQSVGVKVATPAKAQ